jgi:hypothetical protein
MIQHDRFESISSDKVCLPFTNSCPTIYRIDWNLILSMKSWTTLISTCPNNKEQTWYILGRLKHRTLIPVSVLIVLLQNGQLLADWRGRTSPAPWLNSRPQRPIDWILPNIILDAMFTKLEAWLILHCTAFPLHQACWLSNNSRPTG